MALLAHIPHEKFAQHYAVHGNLRKAAADLGLRDAREAKLLLYHPKISKRIEELVGEAFHEARVSAKRTMEELARIAYFDVRTLYDLNGRLLPISELDDDTAAAIASITVEIEAPRGRAPKDGESDPATNLVITKKVKVADKMAALTILARHFKLVGSDDDGVNALANVLADRLRTARMRAGVENATDAQIHEADSANVHPGTRLEYGVPNDPSNGDDVAPPRWVLPKHDALALNSPHPTAERQLSPALSKHLQQSNPQDDDDDLSS